MNKAIEEYNAKLPDGRKQIAEKLAREIDRGLPDAESKIWHGAPVWFLDGNPIAGYDNQKSAVRLLFWSGQSFDESGLSPEGSFKAAEKRYTSVDQVDADELALWFEKAKAIQWDYKNIVKNKGQLSRI
jgi:hypothetical protein